MRPWAIVARGFRPHIARAGGIVIPTGAADRADLEAVDIQY